MQSRLKNLQTGCSGDRDSDRHFAFGERGCAGRELGRNLDGHGNP
jgi:hypothetical protein